MPIPKSAKHDLTPKMLDALHTTMFGVRKYRTGFYAIDDPTVRVDTRSLDALLRRDLIFWQSVGGAPARISIRLTERGEELYYALDRTGQWDERRGERRCQA